MKTFIKSSNSMHEKALVRKTSKMAALFLGMIAIMYGCGSSELFIPVETGDKWGYINSKGEYVINPQFDDAGFLAMAWQKSSLRNGRSVISTLREILLFRLCTRKEPHLERVLPLW